MKLLLAAALTLLHGLPTALPLAAPTPRPIEDPEPDSAIDDQTLAALELLIDEATAARDAGEHTRARQLVTAAIERALPVMERHQEPEHLCLCALGSLAQELADLHTAKRFRMAMVEMSERTLPQDHPQLQAARGNLAVTIKALGDLHGARALEEVVLEVSERTLPQDHLYLQLARQNLARTMIRLGDLQGARALEEVVLEVSERTLHQDHPDLQVARQNLALSMRELGDLDGARALGEALLEVRERTLPDDHPDLQAARGSLAATMAVLGDLHRARVLQEAVLKVRERTLPQDHSDILMARGNLAETMRQLGDLHGARALEEAVLEVFERTLPQDHPDLRTARGNLAVTMKRLGDLQGARAFEEAVLEACERTLPQDHPHLQGARLSLALTMSRMGDLHGARVLQEAVLEIFERTLPQDHRDLQAARSNLAGTMRRLGDLQAARTLEEVVLEVFERTLPQDNPILQTARLNLAVTMRGLGDLHGARALHEGVLETSERTLPQHHPDLQLARENLARTIGRLAAGDASRGEDGDEVGGWPRAQGLVGDMAGGWVLAAHQAILDGSAREAEERLDRGIEQPLGLALSFAAGYGVFDASESVFGAAFVLSEVTRSAALASAALARAGVDPYERVRLRKEIRSASAEVAELVQRGSSAEEYHRARSRREAAERELVRLAREHGREGVGAFEFGVESLASVLEEGTALVGFRHYPRSWLEEVDSEEDDEPVRFEERRQHNLGAFVLRSEAGKGELGFVDLGAWREVDEAVRAWRGSIGVDALERDRSAESGAGVPRGIGLDDLRAGHGLGEAVALRRLVWDPLVEALGDARRILVALDGALHLVALDALPLEEDEELVGNRWRIETRLALWELLDRPLPLAHGGRLVILGGAAFDAEPAVGGEDEEFEDAEAATHLALAEIRSSESSSARSHARARGHGGARTSLLRGSPFEAGFTALPYTAEELRAIAVLYREVHSHEAPARLLEGPRASRSELERWAPEARWLHLATHGWFAPESVRSWADRDEQPDSFVAALSLRTDAEETVRGMSPMLLCGLALAGANLPPDFLGRAPGLVTAEELSTLDLTNCELAVLSACDTNVGLVRAGQGVASLQKALHMAGARSVITSLWKVDDAATAKFFERFYAALWQEGLTKSDALWRTKMELRDEGHPVRDWAAWVLTGDPN